MKQLASVFAIDVAAYAVMSNHYHLVLRIDAERACKWSRDEVLCRWTQLFDGPLAVQPVLAGKGGELDASTQLAIDEWAEKVRARLCELSWCMRVLNETIARKANAETPEDSEHTSVAERIAQLKHDGQRKARNPSSARSIQAGCAESQSVAPVVTPAVTPIVALKCEVRLAELPRQPLMPFDATARLKAAIPFAFDDYLDLVDITGRCIRQDKRGAIAGHTPKLFNRLNIDPEHFIDCATTLMKRFGSAVGAPAQLTELCAARQVKYLRGVVAAKLAFERRAA